MKVKKYFQDSKLKSIEYGKDKYRYYFKSNQGYIKPNNGIKLNFKDFHFGIRLKNLYLNNNIMFDKNHYNWKELKEFFKIVKYLQGKTIGYNEKTVKEKQVSKNDTIKTVELKFK